MEGVFLTLRAIIEVRSDPERGCGLSFPGGPTDRRWSQHRGDFAVLPIGGTKGTLLGLFPTFQGSSPALRKHQF